VRQSVLPNSRRTASASCSASRNRIRPRRPLPACRTSWSATSLTCRCPVWPVEPRPLADSLNGQNPRCDGACPYLPHELSTSSIIYTAVATSRGPGPKVYLPGPGLADCFAACLLMPKRQGEEEGDQRRRIRTAGSGRCLDRAYEFRAEAWTDGVRGRLLDGQRCENVVSRRSAPDTDEKKKYLRRTKVHLAWVSIRTTSVGRKGLEPCPPD
jgi:hypothetical protein